MNHSDFSKFSIFVVSRVFKFVKNQQWMFLEQQCVITSADMVVTNKLLTLAFVTKPGQILLGMKKKGFGVGRWNGFGGKVERGETIEEAAKRCVFQVMIAV